MRVIVVSHMFGVAGSMIKRVSEESPNAGINPLTSGSGPKALMIAPSCQGMY
jgi:hypothetical protein